MTLDTQSVDTVRATEQRLSVSAHQLSAAPGDVGGWELRVASHLTWVVCGLIPVSDVAVGIGSLYRYMADTGAL